MKAIPAHHWVLKDVVVDFEPTREQAPKGDFCDARIELVQPPHTCAFFAVIETIVPREPAAQPWGIQIGTEDSDKFYYLNSPPWNFDFCAGQRRRTLFLAQIPDDAKPPFRVFFVNSFGEQYPIARIARNQRQWAFLRDPEWPAAPIAEHGELPPRLPCFFIGGAPKSGTTWVEKILNAHPNVFCTGEGVFFRPRFPDSLLRWVTQDQGNCSLWVLPKPRPLFAIEQACAAMALHAFRTYGATWPLAQTIGDKTPSNGVNFPLIAGAIPEAKFIHCVRHPLDVVVSRLYHEWNLFRGGVSLLPARRLKILDRLVGDGDTSLLMTLDDAPLVEFILKEWLRYNRAAMNFAYRCPERFHLVCYEDLLNDFRGTVDGLFQFLLGRTPSDNERRQIDSLSSFEYLSGGRDRGTADNRSFFRKGVAGDHRGRFDRALLERLNQQIGPIARQMGYRVLE